MAQNLKQFPESQIVERPESKKAERPPRLLVPLRFAYLSQEISRQSLVPRGAETSTHLRSNKLTECHLDAKEKTISLDVLVLERHHH